MINKKNSKKKTVIKFKKLVHTIQQCCKNIYTSEHCEFVYHNIPFVAHMYSNRLSSL